MLIEIEDLNDERLADYTSMTDVKLRSRLEPERGLFMAESKNVIERAIEAGYKPRSFLMSHRWVESMRELIDHFGEDGGDVPVFVGPEDVLEQVTGFHLHRGAMAAMQRIELPPVQEVVKDASRIVVIEDVVDHTNVGAIFRSAAALGVDAVLVTPSCADPLYRRSVRVSMGTVFQVPWTRLEKWPDRSLQDLGFHVAALALGENTVTLDEFEETLANNPQMRVAWVLGSEGYGLKPRTIRMADSCVMIPMGHGVDSLNVAAAGAVAFWASRKKRGASA
ncbi:MAG: RNA methyltransferase [Actinomycetaceae bacterium]|nr:RNA methyltransferase [Actinomycetaceae bacterium]